MSGKRKLSDPCNISTKLYELKVKGSFCDVQLHLRGSTMMAHACVLASCSTYFLELFDLNQDTHWCARNPLVLNVETLFDPSEDLCMICISKIIDFMYLKELVILQGHHEHFTKINSLFRIFDSVLSDKKLKKIKFDKVFSNNSKIEQTSDRSHIVLEKNSCASNLIHEQDSIYKSNINSVLSDCSLNKEFSSVASNKNERSNDKLVTENGFEFNDKVEMIENPVIAPTSLSESSVELSCEVDKINVKKPCEFMCCNPEPDINSPLAKLRKRRKMFCQLCSFSSVSINKVLQHLRDTDHVKSHCPVCLINIPVVEGLKDHLKYHSESKPFICQICSKRNRYWEYHKIHLKVHCRNKRFYCDLCQRGFLSKRSLSEHLTTHKESYLCRSCDYYTTDLKMYQSHLLKHRKEVTENDSVLEIHLDSDSISATQKERRFQCQVCDERFTQKKNLARHVKLKHFDSTKFKCSLCHFISDRIDLLRIHMKKKHGCTFVKENNKHLPKKQLSKDHKNTSEFVSVVIPIKMGSGHSFVEAHSLDDSKKDLDCVGSSKDIYDKCLSFSNKHSILNENPNVKFKVLVDRLNQSLQPKEQDKLFTNSSDYAQNKLIRESIHLEKETIEIDQSEVSNSENIMPTNYTSMSQSLNINLTSCGNNLLRPQILDGANLNLKSSDNVHEEEAVLERNQYIWLNEATGELLNDETLPNIHVQNTFCKAKQTVSGTENSTIDYCDQLKSSIINEAVGEYSTLEFHDDNDEWQFPQTPQPSVVGIDDCDGIFSWNRKNSFYSTWVLNETTGELNMVSFFSIQSVRTPTDIKLDENLESRTATEDDDTALFLNEGTGDLSVIYFNPNGPDSNNHPLEKTSQDNMETLSDISDDDSDFLNEEFMRASANFMSNEENKKFLNELTGEFDIASLNTYQPEGLNSHVTGNESYLNEETGEISWNVMDDNLNNDLFMKPNGLEYDLDDSLNCEDFEPIFNDVNGFSSQFCLGEASNNWQAEDEATDSLVLNECTGELVKKC